MQSNTIQPVNATPHVNAGFSADFDIDEIEVIDDFPHLQYGAPPVVTASTLATDKAMARAMRCGACGKRGLTLEPRHTEDGTYCPVARCGCCGFGELA